MTDPPCGQPVDNLWMEHEHGDACEAWECMSPAGRVLAGRLLSADRVLAKGVGGDVVQG